MKTFREYITESLHTNFSLTLGSLNQKGKDNFDAALISIKAAVEQGSIRKTELDQLKSVLNGACNSSWEKHYVDEYLNQSHSKRDVSPYAKEEEDLYYSDKGFRNMGAIVKKYSSLANKSRLIGIAVKIAAEYVELKGVLDHLKANVTTGRVPSTTVKVVNPNQVRGTCGWCLRDVALEKTGLMSHHGFTRPGVGYQTQSCNGVSYKNLEVSLDGLKARIKATEQEQEKLKSELKELPNAITLNIRKIGSKKALIIGKDDPNWGKAHHTTKINLESSIRAIANEYESLKKVLQKWEK